MIPSRRQTVNNGDALRDVDLGALALESARAGISDCSGDYVDSRALEVRVAAMAGRLAELGLVPGECLMIVGGARVSTLLAILGAMRAGLDVALAPPGATVGLLGAFAARVGAAALAGQAMVGDYFAMDDLFEIAVRAPDVRFIASLDTMACDGAVNLCEPPAAVMLSDAVQRVPRLATFAPGGGVIYHEQRALALAALDLAAAAGVRRGDTIVSSLAPVSFAGLAAGPFLALCGGARLHFVAPFRTQVFLDVIEAQSAPHVVVPGALAGPVAEGGLLRRDLMTSLMLVDRTGEGRGALAPLGDTGGVRIVDLHAFGEQALIPERRGPDGRPRAPARDPHVVTVEGVEIVAARRREGPGPLVFEGEAISAPPS